MALLRDRWFLVCATFLGLGFLAMLTILSLSNHATDAVKYASLIGAALLQLAALIGGAVKIASINEKVASIQDTTSQTHTELTNGLFASKLDDYLQSRGLDVKQLPEGTNGGGSGHPTS